MKNNQSNQNKNNQSRNNPPKVNPWLSGSPKDKIIGLVIGLIIILAVMYFWF